MEAGVIQVEGHLSQRAQRDLALVQEQQEIRALAARDRDCERRRWYACGAGTADVNVAAEDRQAWLAGVGLDLRCRLGVCAVQVGERDGQGDEDAVSGGGRATDIWHAGASAIPRAAPRERVPPVAMAPGGACSKIKQFH